MCVCFFLKVDAVRTLCLKYPQKYDPLMAFLSSVLREEGGFEYKKKIVESIMTLMDTIKESKEIGKNKKKKIWRQMKLCVCVPVCQKLF